MGRLRRLYERVHERLSGPGAWRTWLGLGLFLLLLAYLGYILRGGLPLDELRRQLVGVHPADLGLAALVFGVNLLIAIGGWGLIIGTLSGYWRWFEHLRIYCLTAITKRLPGSFWYMLGRVVLYERLGVSRGLSALASGLELVAIILSGLLVTLLTWPLALGGEGLNWWVLLAALAICVALLNPPLVRALVRRFGRAAGAEPVRYRLVLLWVAIFAVVWALGGLQLYVIARAVAPLPVSTLPAMIGIWAATGVASTLLFNFLPFGLGATELTLAALLSPFVNPAEALAIALLMRAVLTVSEVGYGLLGGMLYLPDIIGRRGPFAPHVSDTPRQDAA